MTRSPERAASLLSSTRNSGSTGRISILDSEALSTLQILTILRDRPSLLVPDDRYGSIVAFLQGYESASHRIDLDGFRRWLQRDEVSSLVWWVLVIKGVLPKVVTGELQIADFSREQSQIAHWCLFLELERFDPSLFASASD